jgi:hypothetical protein
MTPVNVPALDADINAADLARLTGMSREHEFLSDLCAAVGAYTGFGTASPLTAEIVGSIVAGITAAILAGPALLDGNVAAWPAQQSARSIAAQAVTPGADSGPYLASMPVPPADGQICALFAVDIVDFTGQDRDDEIRLHLHESLHKMLRKSFEESGISWSACFCEDRGDGALIVIPSAVAGKRVIDPLPGRLRAHIRRHNHVSCEAARIQLRAAAHFGPVEHDGHGFVGLDVNFLFRMLDAKPLRRALATSDAELALIVSDYVYDSLVCRYPSVVSPAAFQGIRFQAKKTRGHAWTYLPVC